MNVGDLRLAIRDLPSNAEVRLEWTGMSVDFVVRQADVHLKDAFPANRRRELIIMAHADEFENDEKTEEDGFADDSPRYNANEARQGTMPSLMDIRD